MTEEEPQIEIFITLDGDKYCATYHDFINLQESPAGFGNTEQTAIQSLLKYTND